MNRTFIYQYSRSVQSKHDVVPKNPLVHNRGVLQARHPRRFGVEGHQCKYADCSECYTVWAAEMAVDHVPQNRLLCHRLESRSAHHFVLVRLPLDSAK